MYIIKAIIYFFYFRKFNKTRLQLSLFDELLSMSPYQLPEIKPLVYNAENNTKSQEEIITKRKVKLIHENYINDEYIY